MSDAPRLEYPCAYPIKVLGDSADGFAETVVSVFTRFLGTETFDTSVRASSGGRFVSVTVTITATGPEQIAALHEELKLIQGLRLVL